MRSALARWAQVDTGSFDFGQKRWVIAGEAPGERSQATRDPEERRTYAGDPLAYFSDILGLRLTHQQEEALDLIEAEDRVLLPSGNNLGKTFLLAGYGIYRMDAVAALPDPDRDLPEQGAMVLLPGPDHGTILGTIYASMLEHAARAERRGHLMPGERSDRSVLWHVRERWQVEAFSPPRRVNVKQEHTASGRHHRNQVALIEEGQGVAESLWVATEGMCSSRGNKIASSFNPTEPVGPAFQRARTGVYKVLHLDAHDHPNVKSRSLIIPDAVDFLAIDKRVRSDCQERGPLEQVDVDEEMGDFLYALPPEGVEETGSRVDGILGHPEGEIRVYRPNASYTAQVRGQWPQSSQAGLFSPGAWDKAVERWKDRRKPDGPPDRVGLDVARTGDDDSCTMPAWGDDAATLLQAFVDAQREGRAAVTELREKRRAYVGHVRVLPKGDGPDVAAAADRMWPFSPFNVDEGGVGASAFDHLVRVLGRDAAPISFAARAPDPLPGEQWSENLRTSMYVRAARLVQLGLVDIPDDPVLREEVMAHELLQRSRTVGRGKRKERKPSVLLIPKEKVKERLGRSPDYADAFVLALHQAVLDTTHDPDEWTTVKR